MKDDGWMADNDNGISKYEPYFYLSAPLLNSIAGGFNLKRERPQQKTKSVRMKCGAETTLAYLHVGKVYYLSKYFKVPLCFNNFRQIDAKSIIFEK